MPVAAELPPKTEIVHRVVLEGRQREIYETVRLAMTLLPEMVEEGRRILLFSQFTTMLALIEEEVRRAGIGYVSSPDAPAIARSRCGVFSRAMCRCC